MRRCSTARTNGLRTARAGRTAEAEQFFAEAWKIIRCGKLSTEASLVCVSFQEAAEAYLDYREGAFERAEARIRQALTIDEVLEKHGYRILHLHRVQLLHNLVRILAKRGHNAEAVILASHVLSYLEMGSETPPIRGTWGHPLVAAVPSHLVASMFVQVTGEIALILAQSDTESNRGLFASVTPHAQLQATENCFRHPRAHDWFQVKHALLYDVGTFLTRVSDFFVAGRKSAPLLWYAAVIDLFGVCQQLDVPEATLFTSQVARDAVTWPGLPTKLRTSLEGGSGNGAR